MKTMLLAAALQSFAPAQGKKCVTVGWEFIYTPPAVIAEHADAYRGCGLSGAVFNLFGALPDGRKLNTNTLPEDPSWTRAAFAADEAALKELAKMPEFAHSFIDAVRCPRTRHAWTDDAFWSDYCAKVRIVAAIARDSGMVGVAVDNEDYGGCKQFYRRDGDGDYATAAKLARRRGREVFAAIFEEFPNARVHFDRMYANELWNYYYGADDPRALAEERGDLWVPFVDGALDALPPTAVCYEGDETGYRYDAGHHDALLARSRNQLDLARVAAPEHRMKYRTQVRVALPVYLDRYTRQDPKSRYWCAPVAGSFVGAFERNLADALAASDDYVWLYQEQSVFGSWTRPSGAHKGRNGNPSTWEEEIPGLTDILNAAQHPRAFGERRLAELKEKGVARNLLPTKFGNGGLPSPVNSWQAKEQPGSFGAKDGRFFAEGVGRGGIMWSTRDVREGDVFAVEYEVRGRVGFTQVNFHRTKGVHDLSFPVPRMFAPPEGPADGWRRGVFTVRVPNDVESLLVSLSLGQKPGERTEFRNVGFYRLLRTDGLVPAPVEVTAEGEGFVEKLVRTGGAWVGERVTVRLADDGDGSMVKVQAPSAALRTIRMKWKADVPTSARLYTEKTRGEWATLDEWADSLWFFLLDRGDRTEGWGVRTQPNAFVSWRVKPGAVEAVFDVRAGGRGVKLGPRVLDAAVLLRREGIPGESAFAAGRAFCRMMCPTPRLPKEPVYGYNDWYCAYGANTATNFLADAAYVTEMAKGLRTRPFVVMDDGWQPNSPPEIKRKTGVFDSGCGPWEKAGDAFGMDMKTFAGKIAALGAKPGLWYRPMRTWDEVPDGQRLVNDRRFFDPTVPAVRERIAADVSRFRDWGFKLVKADYITYDFCGQYMHNVKDVSHIVPDSVRWRDESRTTAEVMRDVYRTIREAAGDAMVVIGCNAVNHFAAGLFEIQRTGRDTSGWSWQKTAECGVNALGMRNMMNGTFYAADPDCVGLAQEGAVPWEKNREWLELIARSKSPLFISWRRSLATPDVRAAFRAAFAALCRPGRVGEPLDWQTEALPRWWRFDDGERTYDWFSSGSLGAFENGRRELFSGKDLSNWYSYVRRRGREYDPLNVFAVRGGSIRCSGKEQGWLGSCETFGDVRLEVEFREGGDSGEWNLATLVRKNGVVQRTFARPPTGEIVRVAPDTGRIFLLSEGRAVEFRRVTIFNDSSAASYDVAAYVWPAYQPEPRWAELDIFGAGKGEWQNVWEATPKWKGHVQPLKPLWGYEDESDPKVVEKKIDAAVSHGVNVFIYDWYWYGGRPFLENALDRGFLGASNNGEMKFYLMWANHHVNWLWDNRVEDKKWESPRWRAWVSAAEFRSLTKRWIEKYFRRPNYYRIKGLPVLMIYELSTFVEGVGGLDVAKAALETFRADCVQAGLGGVHLMVCDFGVRENEAKTLGVDSATIYNFVHWSNPKGNPDYADWAEKGARRFDVAKERLGLSCYFAHASVGWDTNPRYPTGSIQPTVLHSTPEKFERALRRAKAWCDRHTPDGFPRLITVNSWNEWTEGSYLEPCEQFGYGYLDAVRKVFGKEGCRVGECEESSSRSRAHRFAVRRAIADSVGTETAESYLTDADPQVRRHALYVIWERDPDRGRARAKTLCGDVDAQVARLAADILDPNRNVSKVRSNIPLSQDKTVDHEILRVRTIVPQAAKFRLPAKIDSDAVELWFAQTPKKKVVVSLHGVPAYEFDPVRAEGRIFRADVTTAVRWSAENVVRITDETGAEMSIPFEVEVLKCGG